MKQADIWHIELTDQPKLPLIPIDITGTLKKETKRYVGLVDTGATNSCLSKKVGDELKFAEIAKTNVNTPTDNGVELKTVRMKFTVHGTDNSILEDSVDAIQLIKNLSNCDILIGLDILQHANLEYNGVEKDFSVSFNKL